MQWFIFIFGPLWHLQLTAAVLNNHSFRIASSENLSKGNLILTESLFRLPPHSHSSIPLPCSLFLLIPSTYSSFVSPSYCNCESPISWDTMLFNSSRSEQLCWNWILCVIEKQLSQLVINTPRFTGKTWEVVDKR